MKLWRLLSGGNFKAAVLILSLTALLFSCNPQNYAEKYDFRGAWVATVKNIDWPSQPTLSSERQKNEFTQLASYHKSIGINALIAQVRPATDAFFESKIV